MESNYTACTCMVHFIHYNCDIHVPGLKGILYTAPTRAHPRTEEESCLDDHHEKDIVSFPVKGDHVLFISIYGHITHTHTYV